MEDPSMLKHFPWRVLKTWESPHVLQSPAAVSFHLFAPNSCQFAKGDEGLKNSSMFSNHSGAPPGWILPRFEGVPRILQRT